MNEKSLSYILVFTVFAQIWIVWAMEKYEVYRVHFNKKDDKDKYESCIRSHFTGGLMFLVLFIMLFGIHRCAGVV